MTATLSVEAVQLRLVELVVVPLAAKLVGTEGAVVSCVGAAEVVTATELLEAETFPAASLACTVKV